MLRAALVVSILLASLIPLSQSLLQDNAESGVVVPQLIELRVDEVNIIDDAAGDTCSPASGKIALVTNIEDLDATTGARPSTGALAQRWGGRSLQRMRSRATPSEWRPGKLPMAGTERPIAPPAPHILPDRNRLEILKKFREVPEGFDNSDLVDPAAVPRRQVTTKRRPPARSPLPRSPLPRSPLPRSAKSPLANQTPAETLPKQSARTEFPPPNTTGQPVAVGYYDADWYKPTKSNKNTMARRDRIRQCLDHYYRRPLNSQEHSPWSLMHTMIAWGSDSYIRAGGSRGRTIGTVHWLAQNGLSDGVRLLYVKNLGLQ